MDNKPVAEQYNERVKRVKDAIALKRPDRVPIVSPVQKFVFYHSNVTMKEVMYDYDVAKKACKKFLYDFEPDMDFGPWFALPGKVLDIARRSRNQIVEAYDHMSLRKKVVTKVRS